jgi:hypothetical protein
MATSPASPSPGLDSADLWAKAGWGVLAVLAAASAYLAVNRIIQVDEAQHVFQSAVLAQGWAGSFYTSAPLHHLGPMAWIALHAGGSESIFLWDRLLFLLVFWLNTALLGRVCAGTWQPRRLLPWLLLAATLGPVWDYGFEIRHDNLLLCGLLVFWLLGREDGRRPWLAYGATGALTVVLQFVAFKSFLYWLPWTCVLFAFPQGRGRTRRILAWTAGAGIALAAVRLAYALGGGWNVALAGFRASIATSVSVERFSPLPSLGRMVSQSPLVVALGLGAVILAAQHWRTEGRGFLRWDSLFPELALVAFTLAAFVANPVPFPYDLLFVLPFLLVAGAAFWKAGFPRPWPPAGIPLLAGVVVFCHALPFLNQTLRHWEHGNDRQVALMNLAETMTDPVKDRVFDGTGLIPTRQTIGFHWLVHSLTIKSLSDGSLPPVRTLLAQRPASVILRTYRLDWLPREDLAYIESHYYPLAEDFLILGSVLPAGGGSWSCLHGGRYQILLGDHGTEPATIQVDGHGQAPGCALELAAGPHDIRTQANAPILVAWLGPSLPALPHLPPGNHLDLFVNWY